MTRAEEPDAFLDGRLTLFQPARGHRAGADAMLLAAAAPPLAKGFVVDLGCGVGAVGLAAALANPGATVALVDNHRPSLRFAERNIDGNGLSGRAFAVEADILAPARLRRTAGLAPGMADLVLANPPFSAPERTRRSPDETRAAAHVMPRDGLKGWIACAADLLKTKGVFVLIHRADALGEILPLIGRAFGGVAIRPIHARAGAPAIRILLRAIKDSRASLTLLPGVVLHEADGRFTPEADAIFRGAGAISW